MKKTLIAACLLFLNAIAFGYAADTLVINNNQSKLLTKAYFHELEDTEGNMPASQVLKSADFKASPNALPILRMSKKVVWLKLTVKNNNAEPFLFISSGPGVIDEFDLYYTDNKDKQIRHITVNRQEDKFEAQNVNYINLPIPSGSSQTIYLRVKSNVWAIIPVKIYSKWSFFKNQAIENAVFMAFAGILAVSVLYNLMLFFIVGDLSYLYYVFYIIFMGAAQTLLHGYGNYLTNNKIVLNTYVIPIVRVSFSLFTLLFASEFLQLKQSLASGHKIHWLLYTLYLLIFIVILSGFTAAAFALINVIVVVTAIYLLISGTYLYVKGFKPAKLFMLGWGFFLVGILISGARVKDFVPYNDFTANVAPFSLVIGIILFSAALADKINFYRNEKMDIQNFAVTVARENVRLITQQNILLENMVKERTNELINANNDLSKIIDNLKSTQHQLVDTEKMASLGRLTAGVAHEINNPINFVSSNITPLRLDFNELFILLDKYQEVLDAPYNAQLVQAATDYRQNIDPEFIKDEITVLLNGIEEGAKRTTEIVKSLFTFSSTDELILKKLDINKAILANLLILRSTIPYYIQIKTVLSTLETLNCYPGKINQMIINLISNSIYAIKAKEKQGEEIISIVTSDLANFISIEITDTGIGMSEDTKQRMFEPFFTTKNVGEGTGLGLSIVFGIIEKHHGSMEVISSEEKGTTFIILLPKNLA
jgi:signal transduction histidine kinase